MIDHGASYVHKDADAQKSLGMYRRKLVSLEIIDFHTRGIYLSVQSSLPTLQMFKAACMNTLLIYSMPRSLS